MSGWFRRRRETLRLTAPAYRVAQGNSPARFLPAILAGLLVIAAGYGALTMVQAMFSPAARVTELEAEKLRLEEALTSARLQAELDAATRAELEKQLAALNSEVKKLGQELSFYKRANLPKQ